MASWMVLWEMCLRLVYIRMIYLIIGVYKDFGDNVLETVKSCYKQGLLNDWWWHISEQFVLL